MGSHGQLKALWFSFLLLFFPYLLFSQEAAAVGERICLWEAASETGGSIHLLGSLHLMKEEDYPLDSRFEEVFNRVDTVVFETDIDGAGSPEFQSYMLSKAFYPDQKSLETELSETAYAALEEFLSQQGIPIQSVSSFKPWFLGLTLTTLQMIQLGYNPALGIDQYFYARAKEENKSIMELESPKYQIDLMGYLADIDQESYIQQIIDDYDQLDSQMEQIVAAWKTGDLGKMDILNDSLREYPLLYEALLADRNHNWLARMEGYLEEDRKLLVIVGAGHMPGKDGLISLLEEKGYRVSQY